MFDEPALSTGPGATAADAPGWNSRNRIAPVAATGAHSGVRFRAAAPGGLETVSGFAAPIRAEAA